MVVFGSESTSTCLCCRLPPAYCLLGSLVLVVVVIIVEGFLFDDIQLDGIQADDFQLDSTVVTTNDVAFVRIGIDVDISFAIRTRSGRHFVYLQ